MSETRDTVTITRETFERTLGQLASFASLLETHPELSSTKASHIADLERTARSEARAWYVRGGR